MRDSEEHIVSKGFEKNVSKKQGVFLNLSKKFDRWFEKGLSDGYSNREIEIMENKCDKVIEKYGIFSFMFLAIFSVIEAFLGFRFLAGGSIHYFNILFSKNK